MATKSKKAESQISSFDECLLLENNELSDAMEHIKAICRMAMNSMNSVNAQINGQTFFSAFLVIETLAGGGEDKLCRMEDLHLLTRESSAKNI